MGSQTSALLKGFDYQFLFTWYQIAAMLQGRSHILKIEIESKDCKSVDDVVIYYDDEGIEDKGKSVYRDFYQVKYHVDKSNSYCCEYLIQKKTSQKSLLEKFFDAFEKIEKDGVSGYRLILVSNWEWDSNDILYKKLREDKEGALPEEFFTSSDKTKIGKIIEKWQSHLNTDREGIIRFAKSLRLDLNHFGRKHFEELVYNRIENAGLIVPDDCNKISNYTQIISNLIQTGLCTITPESIKSICETHGLISKQTVTNIPTPIIGIRSYMRFAERIEDLEFDYVSADLNSDGEAEYIVMPRQNVGVFSRTASGNGDILVLMNRNGKLVVVGELFGNGHTVTNDKNHGFYNITSSEHDSAVTSWQTIYSWEGASLNGSYKMVEDPILIKHEFE